MGVDARSGPRTKANEDGACARSRYVDTLNAADEDDAPFGVGIREL